MRPLALLLLCVGCASAGKFTRPEELEEIARAPVPKAPEQKIANVAEWTLAGPLPERVEHAALADASKPFVQLVLQSAQGRFALTQDLTCVANELARFSLEHDGAQPGLLLGKFIEARCGTPSDHVHQWELYGAVPDDVSDDELVKQWGKDLPPQLATIPQGAFAGIALQRKGGKARLILTWAQDEAQLEALSIFAEGEVVKLRGTVLKPVEALSAAINQGADTSVECLLNPTVKLPQFELACPVKPGSPHDWLGIWVREPGRLLSTPVFTTMVFSHRAPSPTFVRPSVGLAKDGSAQAFLDALNEQRQKLGRPPMTMSPPQTEQARSLVPAYLAAQLNGDDGKVDRIAMGLIAGWRVEGPVTSGWFTSSVVPSEAGPELLALLLELPGGRNQLLSKESRVLALGQVDQSGVTESLVCTYSLLDEPAPTVARQQQLIDKLNAERKRRGLPNAQWVQLPTKTEATVAAAVRATSMDPDDGLEQLMGDAMQIIHQPVRGWQFTSASLDEVKWPDELLERPTLQVMMTIAPWKRKDMPWTQYVFMVVLFEGANTQA